MADTTISLDDKYRFDSEGALINGRQALIRLLLAQRAIDRAAGLNTAGYVTGYRGSPLGGFDAELVKAEAVLTASNITFEPGINEDLALTALAGTQQLEFLPGRKVDGVFGLWYGKGPGVDRSGDAIKHANLAGVSAKGGLVLAFGDDHAGKSSTTAHQSDLTLASWDVPILYPSTVSEIIAYGLAAFAMSRYSGALVGLKLVNETADGTSVIYDTPATSFVIPHADDALNVHIRPELRAMLEQDSRLIRAKLPRAQAFARANHLDKIAFGAARPRLLIVTAGKAHADVLAALKTLGVDQRLAEELGIGVYKVALIFPLEPEALFAAAERADEIVCVEEKRPHLETQAKTLFYTSNLRPRILGKFSPDGAALLPADLPLNLAMVAAALGARISACFPDLHAHTPNVAAAMETAQQRVQSEPSALPAVRRPAFCPGCPHNTSTKVPEGSFGATGIGCHGMALFHTERRPLPMGHMGAEGANWIGLSRYTETPHIFQNLGDGTYSHSGSLAIRAAQAAGVNITYKILYNDAVAMTGGQPVEGGLSVGAIVRQVIAEGVRAVAVLSEDPSRFVGAEALPAGVIARHRDELPAAQEEMRQRDGVSVIVYDQVCAAEKRRRRKAKLMPDPDRRVFINADVCEGCGDCSVQSNCLAIQPLDTELGVKRRIDQSACNKDFSCIKGFCPSFVIVEGGQPRRKRPSDKTARDAAPPDRAVTPVGDDGFDIVLAGVGGTGVTTIAALLGMAARIDGLAADLYDMTGLSQKGGAVFSHVRLRRKSALPAPARVGAGEADTVLACDLIAGVHPEVADTIAPGRTLVVANSDVVATADFQVNRDLRVDEEKLLAALAAKAQQQPATIAATSLSERLLGDSILANVLMLGYAWQAGGIPLQAKSIERAIELNGRGIQANLRAFAAGRSAALKDLAARASPPSLDHFIANRAADLGRYWNASYAARYHKLMQDTRAAARKVADADAYAWAAARSAYKLMAYKDEYEVARLYTDGRFRAALANELEDVRRVKVQLSPPLFATRDPNTGRPRKIAFGGWIFTLFGVLAACRKMREGPLDLFGFTADRKLERDLRDAFLARIAETNAGLNEENLAGAIALAEAPLAVRGYGPVKAPAAEALLARLRRA